MSGFRQLRTIQRQTGGSYVNGEWAPGVIANIQITASVQPAKMEDLINLPQGRRLSDFIKLYSNTKLFTVGEGETQQQPDMFEWEGHTYECTSTAPWKNNVINHYKYIFTKVSQE